MNQLEVDITLDANIGAVDVGSIDGHLDVGSPSIISPLDI
jgi:hypothetical protein